MRQVLAFPQGDKISFMNEQIEDLLERDNQGRRAGADRRQFSYTSYIPERRKGFDRRSGKDRRLKQRIDSAMDGAL